MIVQSFLHIFKYINLKTIKVMKRYFWTDLAIAIGYFTILLHLAAIMIFVLSKLFTR